MAEMYQFDSFLARKNIIPHVYHFDSQLFNTAMKSINDIRRDNMRKLVELHCAGKLKTFEAKVGLSQGQASHLNTGFRNIGDNIALRIENAFNLPTGWMDADQHDNPYEMDSKSIRKRNLASLIELHGSQNALAMAVDTDPAYISQIMSDKTKANIGDALARKIETSLGKPHGWMDLDHDASAASTAKESHSAYGALSPELEELLAAAKAAMNSGSITKDSILSMINLLRSLPQPSNELKTTAGKMQAHFAKARKIAPR